MKKDKKHITDALLLRCLLDELPAIEKSSMLKMSSEDDKRRLGQLQMVWDACGLVNTGSHVNTDNAWHDFMQRVNAGKNDGNNRYRIPVFQWLRVAAILLLLVGVYLLSDGPVSNKAERSSIAGRQTVPSNIAANEIKTSFAANEEKKPGKEQKKLVASTAGKPCGNKTSVDTLMPVAKIVAAGSGNKEVLCNSTAFPIEICIIQKQLCPGGEAAISPTCSRLEPNENGALRYHASVAKKCNTVVDEIIIKKVTTGETLVLDEHSTPAAGELFSYMTGEKKGNIMAGEFNSDCLAFNSSSGDFVLKPCSPGAEDHE